MAARPADPFLRALHDLTPEGVSGPPPAWVRDLVTTEEFRYARDAAERTPVGITIRWLAALLTPAGSALLADFEEGDGIQRIVAVLAGLRPADDPQVEAMVDGLVYATLVTARGSRAQRDAIEALAWLVGDRAAAREILLAAHEADRLDPEATDLYEEVLGRSGADDPRVRAVLLERLAVEPELGAPLMAWHGDVRFVPALEAAWAALPATPPAGDADAARAGAGVADALRRLGRPLTEADLAKRDAYLGAMEDCARWAPIDPDDVDPDLEEDILDLLEDEQHQPAFEGPARPTTEDVIDEVMGLERPAPTAPIEQRRRPGRNDPCWCGSGRKYKKCHHDADAAKG